MLKKKCMDKWNNINKMQLLYSLLFFCVCFCGCGYYNAISEDDQMRMLLLISACLSVALIAHLKKTEWIHKTNLIACLFPILGVVLFTKKYWSEPQFLFYSAIVVVGCFCIGIAVMHIVRNWRVIFTHINKTTIIIWL